MAPRRLSDLFGKAKTRNSRTRYRRLNRGSVARLPESLERRIALTVSHQMGVGPFLTGAPTWATIYSDGGDDIYTSVVAPAAVGQTGTLPDLIYADNASFLDYTPIGQGNYNAISNVYVTNATQVVNTANWQIGGELVGAAAQEANSYPLVQGTTSRFVLPSEYVDLIVAPQDSDPGDVSGTLSNGVDGEWSFTNGGSGNTFTFVPVSTPIGPLPLSAAIRFRYVGLPDSSGPSDAVFDVTWDTSLVGPGGFDVTSPPSIDITYDRDVGGFTNAQAVASTSSRTTFTLPVPSTIEPLPGGYQIVPGSLTGVISIERELGGAVTLIPFTTNGLFSTPTTDANDLVFELGLTPGIQYDDEGLFQTTGFLGNNDRFVRGEIGVGVDANGILVPTLNFVFEGVEGSVRFAQEVGRVSLAATYAIYNQPEAFKGGNYTHYDGLDFTKSLTVDLLSPGCTATVESYIDGTFVDFHASNVIVNAPTSVDSSFTVSDSEVGAAKAEQVFINANTAASTYDLRVTDDPGTDAIQRSMVFISTTGSLAGTLPTTPTTVPTLASSVHVEAGYGDVIVEGKVFATNQSYIVNSAAEFDPSFGDTYGINHRGPYYVTTRAPISGANTGQLIGANVAILLGNDVPTMYDDVANGGARSFNVVDIRTKVDSLRIQAADRALNPIQTPFPYDLTVEEEDRIRIDAVAASSRPISLSAVEDIEFHATVQSASDVTIISTSGNIWMNAPLSTQFGVITLEANQLTVGNSVRVFDTYYDENINDIKLLARNGDLVLSGPISAVNGIEIVQNLGSRVYGDARVVGDRATVDVAGSLTLRTDVRELTGRVTGAVSIDELNDIVVNGLECASGTVTILASGLDLPVARPDGTNAALRAILPDTKVLTVSAPNGSVSVSVSSSDTLSVGRVGAIVGGTSKSMLAGGGVRIETEASSIDVYDAPVAASGAFLVRVASVGNFDGVYNQRTPGTLSSTLTAKTNGSLNSLSFTLNPGMDNEETIEGIDGIKNIQVRDIILLKDQGNESENGIYQVVDVGSSTRPWNLVRQASFDTTSEMLPNVRMRVSEGGKNGGKVFRLAEFENVVGETPKRVATILNRSRSFTEATTVPGDIDAGVADIKLEAQEASPIEVRAISTARLDAYFEYDATTAKSYITSVVDDTIPLFDGVQLAVGDRVLVRLGTRDPSGLTTTVSNGVYTVTSAGSSVAVWSLESVDLVGESAFDTGLVVVTEGSLRTSVTGNLFQVGYDSLGRSGARFVVDTVGTEIGSKDINDLVRFIVSKNVGTNSGTGSLGKMISLSNLNSFLVPVDGGFVDSGVPEPPEPQRQAIAFGASIGGSINLTQALPAIIRTVTIDATLPRVALAGVTAAAKIVVNGTRITTLANGMAATSTTEVNGIHVLDSAPGTKVAGIRVGGFGKGAAVKLDGVSGAQVDAMELGLNALGQRASNKYGVEVTGGTAGYSTVSGSLIYSSTGAGVIVRQADDSIRLVGNTIGARGFENAVGVDFADGQNYLGLVTQTTLLRRVSATRVSDTKFSLPATYSSLATMYVGLGVGGERILPLPGKVSAVISAIGQVIDGKVEFTISDGEILQPIPSAPVLLDFGAYVDFEAGSAVTTIPTGVLAKELYIGQVVYGAGLAAGTRIVELDAVAGTMTLSNAPTVSGITAVGLEPVARNAVAYNTRGVVLRKGDNRIVNTDVSNSVFDGVRLVGETGAKYTIGGGDGRISVGNRRTSKDITMSSNAIFANGSAGIRIGALVLPEQVVIQGNRLGVTSANVASRNLAGNIEGLSIGVSVAEPTATGSLILLTPATATALAVGEVSMTGHGLQTGDIVHLTITGGGLTQEGAFQVTRINNGKFAISLTTSMPLSGTVTAFKYGTAKTKPRAAQLTLTNQRDFEGNLHAKPTTSQVTDGVSGGGGVIARPIVIGRRRVV